MVEVDAEIRNNIHNFMKSNQYQSAIFWSELLLHRNGDNPSDLYLYIKALFHHGQYRRVIHFIDRYQLSNKYLTFRLLAARSYFAIKDGISAIQMLDHQSINRNNPQKNYMSSGAAFQIDSNVGISGYDPQEAVLFGQTLKELENSCYLLLGEIYEHMENRETAIEYYKLAVRSDVKCYAAIDRLHSGNMLTNEDAREFLASLDYSGDCNSGSGGGRGGCRETVAQMIRASYEDLFRVECAAGDEYRCENKLATVGENNEHHRSLLNAANRYYNNSRFKKAYELTKRVANEDPQNPHCVILHSAVLTELKYANELFSFASSLIDNYPDKKESWYAIGCYYLSTNRYGLARLQFLKATEIDKFFGEAWLAVGHTYSADNERDQALAAYCSASQAIKGCHIPILYIALEYSLSNNSSVSINYLQEAMQLGSRDPHCWHEKGFIAFNNKSYQDALKFFLRAYDSHRTDQSSITGFWEPLLNNIAHCFYKLGDYDKSLEFFEKALGKKPKNPSTMSSMALVYTRKGDLSTASNYLNRVLGLDRENNFARSLMMTLTNLNCKYSNKSICDDSSNDLLFKLPQTVSKETATDRIMSQTHFESLRQILNMDASKIIVEENEMDLF